MTNKLHSYESKEELHAALVERITKNLSDAIAEQGCASLLVSGGSTPKPLFEKLSRAAIAWEKVTVSLVDERWVDTESGESNERLVRTTLLQNRAETASFIGLKNSHTSAREGIAECEAGLKELPTPPDVVILGMGGDGHTASFFPQTAELKEALDMKSSARCTSVTPLNAPHERMTLTRAFLLSARNLLLHIEGEEKLRVYHEALGKGSIEEMPVRAMIRQEKIPLEVYHA